MKNPAKAGFFVPRVVRLLARVEADRAARGDRRTRRFEAPALDRGDRLAVEHPRRIGAHHAGAGHRAVRAHGELHLHLARTASAQGGGRVTRRRRTDRAQVARGDLLRLGRLLLLLRGPLLRRTLLGGALFGCTLRGRTLLGFALGGGLGLGLLRGQLFGRLLLLLLLLRLALLLQLLAPGRFLFRAGTLLLDAPGFVLLRGSDAGLQPRQRRVVLVGLLDQAVQALRFLEVAAVAALFGGDHGHRQQVGQGTGHARVARQLVAQRQVILHRVVAGRRVEPAFLVGRGGLLAQVV